MYMYVHTVNMSIIGYLFKPIISGNQVGLYKLAVRDNRGWRQAVPNKTNPSIPVEETPIPMLMCG